MQQRSKILLGTAAALAAALTIYLLATAPKPSDEQQIVSGVETARAAIQAHNSAALLTVVSANYKDAVFANEDQMHYALNRTLHESGHLKVSATGTTVTITGDTAKSVSHITIQSADRGNTFFDGNVTLTWQHEPANRFLVFPTKAWYITTADYPNIPFQSAPD